MNRLHSLVIVATLAVILAVSLLGCSGGSSGPEDAVRGALQAMEEMDAEKMATYFTADVRNDVELGMQFTFSLLDEIEITDIEIDVLSRSEDSATVKFTCYVKTTAFEQTEEGPMEKTLEVVKEDGQWRIKEFDMFD